MVKPEKATDALYALQAVLIKARTMARDLGNAGDLAELLDVAENLPHLLASEQDETENFRRILEEVAKRHKAAFVLQRFDGERLSPVRPGEGPKQEREWLEDDRGLTTDQLLALVDRYRVDSIVVAFETALLRKAGRAPLSREERVVLAVEALEREVNNGGYAQFLLNDSKEFVPIIVGSLLEIGCPRTAGITQAALHAPDAGIESGGDGGQDTSLHDPQRLEQWDRAFLASEEDIAGRLLEWIGRNRESIRVGPGTR